MSLNSKGYFRQWLILIFCFLSTGNLQAQDKINLLQRAYEIDSSRFFNVFMNYWSQKNPLVADSAVYQNDTIKETYRLFTSFFNPSNFDTIEGSALSKSFYEKHPYLVVQNEIKVSFVKRIYYTPIEIDSLGLIYTKNEPIDVNSHQSEYDYFLEKDGKIPWDIIQYNGEAVKKSLNAAVTCKRSISNFTPSINCSGKTPVYLTNQLDTVINSFLGNKYNLQGHNSFTFLGRGENLKRKRALDSFAKVWYTKSADGWQLICYPYIQSLTFDKHMGCALLKIKLAYQGAEVILKKVENTWVIVSFKREMVM